MLIMSFAHTADALVAGRKTVTRRCWKESHAAKFTPGTLVAAWDHLPHRGGKKIAVLRIVSVRLSDVLGVGTVEAMREGFADAAEFFMAWRKAHGGRARCLRGKCYRVEFELVEVHDGC